MNEKIDYCRGDGSLFLFCSTPPDDNLALRLKGTSLRNMKQCLGDVYSGFSQVFEGLLDYCGVRKLCFRSQAQPAH
jgi:hypothetical protein